MIKKRKKKTATKKQKPESIGEDTASGVIKERRRQLRNKDELVRFIGKLILFAAIIWVMIGIVFGIKPMNDMSMHPRISPRDLIIYYRFNPINQVSKVMVYEKAGQEYVGRIVARPGDKVEVKNDGGLKVNGAIVAEPDIFYQTRPYDSGVKYPLKLGVNEYFILCDHREGSKDSRYFGPVSKSELKGEVIAVIRKSSF